MNQVGLRGKDNLVRKLSMYQTIPTFVNSLMAGKATITNGIPQGLVRKPLSYTLYISNMQ